MSGKSVDLLKLFSSVTSTLEENRAALNKADTGNQDHGDNMVEIFSVITQAMQERKNANPADQLEYAANLLRTKQSGSAQVYAQGLTQAAQQFQGQRGLDPAAGMQLVQMLLGGGQVAAGSSQNPLAGLLGDFLGGGAGADKPAQEGDAGLDMGDLLNAGMAFLNAKQSGASSAEAAINAILSASPLSQTPHREQSGQLVAGNLLEALAAMSSGK